MILIEKERRLLTLLNFQEELFADDVQKKYLLTRNPSLCLTIICTPAQAENQTLHIYHTNDIHATFDQYGKVSSYINEQRDVNDNVLYFDAGDFASGNPVVDLNFGKPMIDVFNLAGLDAFTIGNHEFDYGQSYLQDNIEASTFPWLGANVNTGDTGVTNPDPYTIFELNDLTVAVLGITQHLLQLHLQM